MKYPRVETQMTFETCMMLNEPVVIDEEDSLIEHAKSDPRAFAKLYRMHYQMMANYLYRRTGDTHATEDLLSEVFLAAMKSLPRYKRRGVPIRFWLYRIATNAANNWIRKKSKETNALKKCLYREVESQPTMESPEITRVLQALPAAFQSALVLHYVEGLSIEHIALVLNCRQGTVKSRLWRGRELLRTKLLIGEQS